MEILNIESIRQIGASILEGFIEFHPTTLTFIEFILRPYAIQFESMDLIDINRWIFEQLPISERNFIGRDENQTKTYIIRFLIIKLSQIGRSIAVNKGDSFVLPWDILIGINENPELMSIFNFDEDNRLLVTLRINNHVISYSWDYNFACGVLLYSHISRINIDMKILGVLFSSDYFNRLNVTRFTANQGQYNKYAIDIRGQMYGFDTMELPEWICHSC